jgi:DNA-binding PadR family transcriptional regulator
MRRFDKTWDPRRAAFGAFGVWGAPYPPHQRGRGRGRGRRGRRGDVRAAVLALLTERPMHGYEMIQELDARTGGIWRPSPGSVYPTLQLLEDEGLIASEASEGRKRFTLTDAAREEAAQAAEKAPWSDYADEDEVSAAHDFRTAVHGIMSACREIGFTGTDEQRAQALDVLRDTKRKLYAILAESD